MKKQLGNQGFAITGILYTLFVLFLLVLMSVLTGLAQKKNILERTISSFDNDYLGTMVYEEGTTPTDDIKTSLSNQIAPVTGKYYFKASQIAPDHTSITYQCTSYLKKGDSLQINSGTLTFIPDDCNRYTIDNLEVIRIYSFEKEG